MTNQYKRNTGVKRVWKALLHSLDGFGAAFKYEDAFQLEVVLALILIPLAFSMHVNAFAKALMIASVLLVLIVELLNSAIEAVTDRVSLERHVLAKRAKDFGSAAVMLSVINVLVVWSLVLAGVVSLIAGIKRRAGPPSPYFFSASRISRNSTMSSGVAGGAAGGSAACSRLIARINRNTAKAMIKKPMHVLMNTP